MSKFKVGDKVRVRRGGSTDWLKEGECGVVTSLVTEDGDCWVKWDTTGEDWFSLAYMLELVEEKEDKVRKFKVGDKVRVISLDDKDMSRNEYKVGEVFSIDSINEHLLDKKDAEFALFHSQVELVKKPKTELRIVYKVTTDEYKSVNNGDCVLTYTIEQKTKTPKGGNPLIAFASWDTAIRFVLTGLNTTHGHILKCVGKVRVDDTDFSFMEGVVSGVPDGSVLCDWVFPIEQIK